jgi:hypothetical protein
MSKGNWLRGILAAQRLQCLQLMQLANLPDMAIPNGEGESRQNRVHSEPFPQSGLNKNKVIVSLNK